MSLLRALVVLAIAAAAAAAGLAGWSLLPRGVAPVAQMLEANDNTGTLAEQARLLALAGRGDAAIATLLEQQQKDPTNKDVALALATAYEQQDNLAAASEVLMRVAPYYPGDDTLTDAQCHLRALQADGAALAQCTTGSKAALWQVLAALAGGDVSIAMTATSTPGTADTLPYTQATTAYSGLRDVPVYYLQALWAEAARTQGYYAVAERLAQQVLAAEPTYIDGYVQLAYAQYAQKHYQQAEATARQGIARDATAPRPYVLLGLALGGQQRYDEALGAYQRALDARYPERARLQQLLGDTYQRLGNTTEANKAYTGAVAETDATLPLVLEVYAGAVQQGAYAVAEAAAQQATRLDTQGAYASALPLEVGARRGNTAALIDYLRNTAVPADARSYLEALVAQLQQNTEAAKIGYAAAMQGGDDWWRQRAAAAYLQL